MFTAMRRTKVSDMKTPWRWMASAALAAGILLVNARAPSGVLAGASPSVDSCAAPFPSTKVGTLVTGSGTRTFLEGRGGFFRLTYSARFRSLAGWSFTVPGTVQTYQGRAHVFSHGTRRHVCLQGLAYPARGNPGENARSPILVKLNGNIDKLSGRVTLALHRDTSFSVGGHPFSTTAGIRRCAGNLLAAYPSGSDAGLGHEGTMFRIHNMGSTACSLRGYPSVRLVDARGGVLATHVQRGPGYLSGNPPVSDAVLVPGGNAYFVLEWDHMPGPGQSCPTSRRLLITMPKGGATRSSFGPGGAQACGGYVHITPIEPVTINF